MIGLGEGFLYRAGHSVLIWSIFILLSVLHIYANIRAARSLQLMSLNPARLDILLAQYLAKHVRILLCMHPLPRDLPDIVLVLVHTGTCTPVSMKLVMYELQAHTACAIAWWKS